MLDAHRLRTFLAVAAEGSVGRAAANLGYTPSAVSQQLTTLQRDAGLTLIERVGRGIAVTSIGEIFAKDAAAALDGLAALEKTAEDLRAGRVGRLAITYFASAGATWVPAVVAGLRAEFPQVSLDLSLVELGPVGEPDIELCVAELDVPPPPGRSARLVTVEDYFVVVPADHRLASAEAVRLEDLSTEHWIDNDVLAGPCRSIVHDACAARGFVPQYTVQTQDHTTAMSFVAAGVGVTVLPNLAAESHPSGTARVLIVDPTPRRAIWLRTRDAVAGNPAVERFGELLFAQVAAQRGSRPR